MNLQNRERFKPFVVAIFLSIASCSSAAAQQFKIETAIHAGDQKTPVAQNITLFQDNIIVDLRIDFAIPPNVLETKVYDARQKKVTLLDHQRQVRVEISDNQLLQMVDGLRRDISQREELSFLVKESFTETQQLEISKVILASPSIRYQLEGERPADTTYLKIHGEFLDIFTRLNASDPGGFPPFARLRLNESIKQMGWIPSKVKISIQPNPMMPDGLQMSSTHVLIDGLSQDDQAKVEIAKKQWVNYTSVSLLNFRGIEKTATLEETVEASETTK